MAPGNDIKDQQTSKVPEETTRLTKLEKEVENLKKQLSDALEAIKHRVGQF